jgi:hypothetical protein
MWHGQCHAVWVHDALLNPGCLAIAGWMHGQDGPERKDGKYAAQCHWCVGTMVVLVLELHEVAAAGWLSTAVINML